MARREKLKNALRYFHPNTIPGPAIGPFVPVAKLGSTQSGSYVEGDFARGAGGLLLQKSDGFIEDINGVRRGPNKKTRIILNFYDKNTLAPLPGEVVYSYQNDINLAVDDPLSAPAAFDADLKPYLTGGTGIYSDSGLSGEITIGLVKQTWGETNLFWYDDAVELGISMQIQSGSNLSDIPTSWVPINCTEVEYAYIPAINFPGLAFFTQLNNFTRISPITIENAAGATASGEPGNDIIVASALHDVGLNANNTLHITIHDSSTSFAVIKISFEVRHNVTLAEYTVYNRIVYCWHSSFDPYSIKGFLQTIPAYSVPAISACNSTSFVFLDRDSLGGMSVPTAVLTEDGNDITPPGLVANSVFPVTYQPEIRTEAILRADANAQAGTPIYAETNLIQLMKKI